MLYSWLATNLDWRNRLLSLFSRGTTPIFSTPLSSGRRREEVTRTLSWSLSLSHFIADSEGEGESANPVYTAQTISYVLNTYSHYTKCDKYPNSKKNKRRIASILYFLRAPIYMLLHHINLVTAMITFHVTTLLYNVAHMHIQCTIKNYRYSATRAVSQVNLLSFLFCLSSNFNFYIFLVFSLNKFGLLSVMSILVNDLN